MQAVPGDKASNVAGAHPGSAETGTPVEEVSHKVVIVGGGTGGLTVASRLKRRLDDFDVAIIEPSDKHYYQPLWTLVGGGRSIRRSPNARRPTTSPKGPSGSKTRSPNSTPKRTTS